MSTSEIHEQFLDEALSLKNHDFEKRVNLIDKIDSYLSENAGDLPSSLLLQSLKFRKIANDPLKFEECRALAAPMIDELEKAISWQRLEFYVLTAVIGYTYDYNKSLELADEAIAVLEDEEFANKKEFIGCKHSIIFNIIRRLLRALQSEIDPADTKSVAYLTDRFNYFYDLSMAWCIKIDHTALVIALEIRRAIFINSYEDVLSGMILLDKINKQWQKFMQEEVAEYACRMQGKKIPSKMIRFLIGVNIRTLREERNLSTLEFALMLDTSQQVVNGFESGRRGISNEKLSEVANILRVDIAYFYTFNNTERQNSLKRDFVITDPKLQKLFITLSTAPEEVREYTIKLLEELVKHQISLVNKKAP